MSELRTTQNKSSEAVTVTFNMVRRRRIGMERSKWIGKGISHDGLDAGMRKQKEVSFLV